MQSLEVQLEIHIFQAREGDVWESQHWRIRLCKYRAMCEKRAITPLQNRCKSLCMRNTLESCLVLEWVFDKGIVRELCDCIHDFVQGVLVPSSRTSFLPVSDPTYSPLHVASRAIISALDTSMAGLRRRLHGHTHDSSSTSEPHTLHCACAPETKPTTKEKGAGKTLSFYPSYQSANESTTSISSDVNYSDGGSGALRQTGAAKYSLANAKKLLGSFRRNR